ncbi:UNVERIFIED_ORG: hypothetical protein C7429_10975 [Pantoea allii]|uniref:Uncharacterized protein n=1 Tax=Enterobacter agglomerans TaxID=549 RepID=A0AAN2FCR1_ENTAG|nr:hypothetical protein DAPPPG734_09390 [Pantoea agglomerans]
MPILSAITGWLQVSRCSDRYGRIPAWRFQVQTLYATSYAISSVLKPCRNLHRKLFMMLHE